MNRPGTRLILDITRRLDAAMVAWPDEVALHRIPHTSREAGDIATTSLLSGFMHTGTHLDVPVHFIPGGATLDDIDLGVLIGPCRVVEHLDDRDVAATDLEHWGVGTVERLLIKTTNKVRWHDGPTFRPDYVAIDLSAADWLVEHGCQVVGIDYLSIETYEAGDYPVHRTLLGNGVLSLEGLDLDSVPAGDYELIALPLRIAESDGSPVRAILREFIQ